MVNNTPAKKRVASDVLVDINPVMSGRRQMLDAEIRYYMERHTPVDEGFDMVARYAQRGDSTMAVYLPQGRMTLHNTLLHAQGKALVRDAQGRLVIGRFQADTLVSGVRIDSVGFYAGMMNRRGEAWGHGFYRGADGSYYEGRWTHDQRNGFGLSIGPGYLRVGAWLRDQFRGERMSYHSDRIYGIDISRYQHERGRRTFPIHWNALRIWNLGRRISQERVADTLNYPVSFVYIKSTEGVTIENKYYDADDFAVRSQGLPVGAYHFFSTTTSADDQARHFINNTRFCRGDLPPMLDVEPSDAKIEQMGGPLVLFDAMRRWLQLVEQKVGVKPLIYVNQRFVNTYLHLAPDLKQSYRFWIARYGEYKPDVHLDIWQLAGDGHVTGITPEVDINVFNGYQGQWDDFLRKATIP
ncbi:MAG: glycosyl hydrolase family 25 [Prevotella sp.]|nr:glycosyl hydrolase family 25 [Prevotella sp.]